MRSGVRRRLPVGLAILAAACGLAATPADGAAAASNGRQFVAAWAMGVQDPGPLRAAIPYASDMGGRTVRNVVRPTLSGSAARIRLSNRYGTKPLRITDARIATSAGRGATAGRSHRIRFGGRTSVTIPIGDEMTSDPVRIAVRERRDLAISLYVPAPTGVPTGGGSLFHTNYVSETGDFAGSSSAKRFPNAPPVWYYLSGVDVLPLVADASAVAVLGGSIAFGYSSTRDAYKGWVDILGRRLRADHRTRNIAVVNTSIAGNAMTQDTGCFGESAIKRLSRDALRLPGVRTVLFAVGSNDLTQPLILPNSPCNARNIVSSDEVIDVCRKAIKRIHARGMRAILTTITPTGGYQWSTPDVEAKRQRINDWIRSSRLPDGVIDQELLAIPGVSPPTLAPKYDSGDGLHPNNAGHAALGNSVDLSLFRTR
jgi:lysophospholipase L1-like esterase